MRRYRLGLCPSAPSLPWFPGGVCFWLIRRFFAMGACKGLAGGCTDPQFLALDQGVRAILAELPINRLHNLRLLSPAMPIDFRVESRVLAGRTLLLAAEIGGQPNNEAIGRLLGIPS
jgi:hypothetical protein